MGKNFSYNDFQVKNLREMARELGVSGWARMSKADLAAKLGALDPTGRRIRSKQAAAAAAKPSAAAKKVSAAKSPAASPRKKEAAPKKSAVRGSAPAAKPEPVKKAQTVKTAESKPAKTSAKPASGEKPAAGKSVPVKKAAVRPAPPKRCMPAAPSPRPRSSAARVNVVRSKLGMTPAEPFTFSQAESADRKSKRRRLPPPAREDVTQIPVSPSKEGAVSEEPVKETSRPDALKENTVRRKTLETPSSRISGKDRIVLQVCGPFWLHAWWEISANIITRIRAAMGYLWHTADPILRLYRVRQDAAGGRSTEFVNDFLIQGGVYNWFLNVSDPPGTFFVEIGYLSRDKQFFSLVSSNTVETPQNYIQESMGWSDSSWNMLAASTTHSPFESGTLDAESPAAPAAPRRRGGFSLQVDAEVVIKGQTSPDAQLTVRGERIWVREDGSFLIRYHLPERRHVFPVAAVSRDGIDTKTIVLTVERNTKNLETVVRMQQDED